MKIINLYKFRHMHQNADFRFTGHRHGRYEANIILSGTIELTCGSNIFTVPRDWFAIWKPGVFHMSRVVSDGAELISMEFELDDDSFPMGESAVIKLDGSDVALAKIMDATSGEALIKLTEAFFIRLSDRDAGAKPSESGLSGLYHRAVSFMAENLRSDLSVAQISKHCGVCITTLKKAFSEYAGKGVRAYFMDMKLHKARELLEGDMTVSEVSDFLGFSSSAYFSQCFKRCVGVSPKKFKNSGCILDIM